MSGSKAQEHSMSHPCRANNDVVISLLVSSNPKASEAYSQLLPSIHGVDADFGVQHCKIGIHLHFDTNLDRQLWFLHSHTLCFVGRFWEGPYTASTWKLHLHACMSPLYCHVLPGFADRVFLCVVYCVLLSCDAANLA